MTTRIAINGMGRIGRLVLRALLERQDPSLHLVAMNDLGTPESLAHLLKWDSVHGPLQTPIEVVGNALSVGGVSIPYSRVKDPKDLPWRAHAVDIVLECTGKFTTLETAGQRNGFLFPRRRLILIIQSIMGSITRP